MALGIGHPAVGAILAPIDTNFCYRKKAYYKIRMRAGFVKTILSDKLKFKGVASPVSGGLRNIISCLDRGHAPGAMPYARIWFIHIAAAPEIS